MIDPRLAVKLKRAARTFEESRVRRDALMVEAVATGGSFREVAGLVGLSHPTVMALVARAAPAGQETQQ